jgi:hypothetical protein
MKQNQMSGLIQAGIIGSALLLVCASARAIPYTEILHENDPLGVQTGPGNSPPTSMGVIPDNSGFPEQSVGGHSTLAYALSNNGGNQMVPGDVLIYRDAAHTVLSDVLRFEDYGVGYVFIYSGVTGVSLPLELANTGLPTAFQANSIAFTEEFNGTSYGLFDYTPTAGEPGYSTYVFNTPLGTISPGLNYTYNFTSDEVSTGVPDGGATVGLLGMGLVGLASLRKWLART